MIKGVGRAFENTFIKASNHWHNVIMIWIDFDFWINFNPFYSHLEFFNVDQIKHEKRRKKKKKRKIIFFWLDQSILKLGWGV